MNLPLGRLAQEIKRREGPAVHKGPTGYLCTPRTAAAARRARCTPLGTRRTSRTRVIDALDTVEAFPRATRELIRAGYYDDYRKAFDHADD